MFAPMVRTGVAFLTAALCVGLAACGGGRGDAARTAERLLAAVRTGDRVAFEAEIDRPAVREDLRRQIAAVAEPQALVVEGGPSDLALDRMIAPDVVRRLPAGQAGTDAADIAKTLKAAGRGRLCLPAGPDGCLLTFGKQGARWRLVGMQALDAG